MQDKKPSVIVGATIVLYGAANAYVGAVSGLAGIWNQLTAPFTRDALPGTVMLLGLVGVACYVLCSVFYQRGSAREACAARAREQEIRERAEREIQETRAVRDKLGRAHDVLFAGIDSAVSSEG